MLLETKNLTIGYEKTLLKDISLSFAEGSFIPLLGANGVGKSTLLKSLAGLIESHSGEIHLEGKNLGDYSPQEKATLMAISLSGYLNTGLMTCQEFVSLGYYATNHISSEADQLGKTQEIMEELGITHLKNEMFSNLSDGQKEWIKLARVLAQDTDIILLDEPMSHLDIAGKVKMMSLLEKEAKEKAKAIIMTSHDWPTIRKFSQKIYAITQQGNIELTSPEDLILKKKLNEIYNLKDESYFEDSQGEISTEITPRFTLTIEYPEDLGVQKFWLEHALLKLGYNQEADNKLPNIKINKESFTFDGEDYSSIAELVQVISSKI